MSAAVFSSLDTTKRIKLATLLQLHIDEVPNLPVNVVSKSQPTTVKPIIGDGNGLFRAVAYVMTGTSTGHKSLREAVVKHMRQKCNTQLRQYMSKNVDMYISEPHKRNV